MRCGFAVTLILGLAGLALPGLLWQASAQAAAEGSPAAAVAARANAAAFPLTRMSRLGRYRITLAPESGQAPLRTLHRWHLRISPVDGASLPEPLQIGIGGGMYAHGHGLPTQPSIAPGAAPGEYWIEGLRFGMPGSWNLDIVVLDAQGRDGADFAFEVDDALAGFPGDTADDGWSAAERAILHGLSLDALPTPLPDPGNRVADNPAAAELGWRLFYDRRLSASGEVACANCHLPDRAFAGAAVSPSGPGQAPRDAPSLIGVGHGRWFYWDGRRDSLWAQALSPMEAPGEMSATRLDVLRYVTEQADYRRRYQALFGPLPSLEGLPRFASPIGSADAQRQWQALTPVQQRAINRAFANLGKALAAFEARLLPGPSRFDRYARVVASGAEAGSDELNAEEVAGLRLFLRPDSQCRNCHNGPLFSNGGFHNIGTGRFAGEQPDFGRLVGVQAVLADEFNCHGEHSDAKQDDCAELNHLDLGAHGLLAGAYKVPSLRNAGATAPYMHDGRYATLEQAIAHYRDGDLGGPGTAGEIKRLAQLSQREIAQIAAFLRTLDAPAAIAEKWRRPPAEE